MLLSYLWPNEIVLRCIIIGIWGLALWKLWQCVQLKAKTQKNLSLLDENNPENIVDVEKFKRYFENPNVAASQKSFDDFATQNGKDNDTEALFDHLNTMRAAKARGKSFDTEILVDKTIEKIFAGTETITATITLYLVMGILGTLFGLASSLDTFGSSGIITSDGKMKDLAPLYRELRSAFAPSINGVLATIISVLAYTHFILEKCINTLNQKLTVVTIKKWVPVLFPSESEESVRQINEAIDHANRISENYGEMNNGLENVVTKLSEANESVSQIITASEALKDTAVTFKDGAEIIGTLTASVKNLSTQSEELRQAVTSTVNQAIQNAAVLHKNSIDMLAGSVNTIVGDSQNVVKVELEELQNNFATQKQQLDTMVHTLKLYDAHFMELNKQIQDSLVDSCKKITVVTEQLNDVQRVINEKDQKIITTVGQPLQEKLELLEKNITMELGKIATRIGNLQNPMSEAAEKIQQMFYNMEQENEDLYKRLAAKGLSEEQIKVIKTILPTETKFNTSALEMKLGEVVDGLKDLKKTIDGSVVKSVDTHAAIGKKVHLESEEDGSGIQHAGNAKMNHTMMQYIPFVAVGLLFISIVVQTFKLVKMSNIAEQQNNMTKVITELKESQEVLTNAIKVKNK